MAVNNVVLLSEILPSASRRTRQAREAHRDVIDLEFSDYGRDPRFMPGWWILPGVLIGAALTVFIAGTL